MSRESWEEGRQAWQEEMFGKGPGDPDRLGHYPGEPAIRRQTTQRASSPNWWEASRMDNRT